MLSSAPTETGHDIAFAAAEQAARTMGLSIKPVRISAATDLRAVFGTLNSDKVDAILLPGGVLPRPVQQRIVELVAEHRLPAMYPVRDYVELGGLMSYAYRGGEMFRHLATYVDRILKGAKPGDLPLTIWDRHYLTVNPIAAAEIRITLPETVLKQAEIVTVRR